MWMSRAALAVGPIRVVTSQPGKKRKRPSALNRAAISAIVLMRTYVLSPSVRHRASGNAAKYASNTEGSMALGGHPLGTGATSIQRSGSVPRRLWSVMEKKS